MPMTPVNLSYFRRAQLRCLIANGRMQRGLLHEWCNRSEDAGERAKLTKRLRENAEAMTAWRDELTAISAPAKTAC